MKRLAFLAAIALTATAVPALGTDVGVSINIGQPGFYGQLDIGNVARPRVLYSRPVIIERAPRGIVYEPVYLRVPPQHSRNWRNYCGRYNACGRPVYFVRDDWYNKVYVPYYRQHHRDYRNDRDWNDRDWRNDRDRRDDRNWRDNDRDNDDRYRRDGRRN